MKQINKLYITAFALAALTASAWAQTQIAANSSPANGSPIPAAAATPAPDPAITTEIQALKEAITAQKDALTAQQSALAEQQKKIQALEDQLQRKTEAVDLTASSSSSATPVIANAVEVQGSSSSQTPDSPQTYNKEMEGPLTLHFRGINITPGGYVEGAFVRRSRALGADIPTPFNSLTMPGASQSQLPEFFGSGRQSKITAFADGRLANVDLSAYVSADFLSSGISSTSNQTDSYTLRLRQAWGQAKFNNGWSLLAGQSWGLLTENGTGISPDDDLGRTNDARPKTIDPSYNVGFVFARQFGTRLTKSFGDKVAVAVAIENPQATLTTHGNPDNFLLGSAGSGSGAYNSGITGCTSSTNATTLVTTTTCTPAGTYSFNPSPDVIAKAAFDPGFGHYEVFAIWDRFKDRVFPCAETYTISTTTPPTIVVGAGCPSVADAATAAAAYNSSRNGGGFGASARWNVFSKRLTFGLKGFGGSGVGRYGPAGLPDVSVYGDPAHDGQLHIVKNLLGLSTLEWNGKKLTLYAYTGAEYAGRTASFDPFGNSGAGAEVGYGATGFKNSGCYTETPPSTGVSAGFNPGSLSSCTADTRAVVEGTGGFWYKFYSGPRGRFQYGIQYSYVDRSTWSGAKGLEPHGIDNMFYSSFRYYLP